MLTDEQKRAKQNRLYYYGNRKKLLEKKRNKYKDVKIVVRKYTRKET